MSDVTITILILVAVVAVFIWNRLPAAVVAVAAALALFLTGVLNMREALGGFGDPVIVFVASLLAIGAGLEASGVGTWAGQFLIRHAGASQSRLLLSLMLLGAVFSGLIGMNGAVAAMIPVAVVIAIRTRVAPSQLMIPVAFATLAGSKLTLLGTPVNVIASAEAEVAGLGPIRFFEWAVVGVPLVAGTIVLILVFGRRLLPERHSQSIPADFSAHASTLVEQYRLDDGLHRLRVRSTSPYVGKPRTEVDLQDYRDLGLVAVLEGAGDAPLQRPAIAADDLFLVRGDAAAVGRLAAEKHLAIRQDDEAASVGDTLFNRASGLAEVVIPPRSGLVGQLAFPGMVARDGDLMVLAVQRAGDEVGPQGTQLAVGDHLLLQGTWQALDKHLADPQMLVVDSPEVVRRQAVALGPGAREAIGVLVLLVVLLATNVVPAAIAAVFCAALMVVMGVLTLPKFYRGIDWNTCVVIGGTIPLATALTKTGAAALIGDQVVRLVGEFGPHVVLAALFLVTAAITQFIANTSAALIMIPIAVATAGELNISALPLVVGVAMGASASFLTPVGSPVVLMVQRPGGYEFGDYWKLGLLVLLWSLFVAVLIAPLYWRF
ncbi:MAG TPA: SLC13 family permease [Stellaceae bacterium]|jgi:di/tricarboxylate transporter|nr:SLC13 family permease [Stellaceae bacterium]HEX3418577.1 SLC13 family permease [Stellaceae bacterium]